MKPAGTPVTDFVDAIVVVLVEIGIPGVLRFRVESDSIR